ncbi:MAG: prepilin-type N-terminal cleavage/methylation domain-containing protein [Candidatus Aminicenantales bacterium]
MVDRKNMKNGFSLIEVLVGIALIGTVLIGLAQLFTMSVMNNLRSSEISNATFLAQQNIDYLRSLTESEMSGFPSVARGESGDEAVDLNADGTTDFRRLTRVTPNGEIFDIRVWVFPAAERNTPVAQLLADPERHHVQAQINTVIGR